MRQSLYTRFFATQPACDACSRPGATLYRNARRNWLILACGPACCAAAVAAREQAKAADSDERRKAA